MTTNTVPPKGKYQIPAIRRAFQVLEVLGRENRNLTVSQIHRTLKIPLSTTATILYTLRDLGYVERDPDEGHYRLTAKLFAVSRGGVGQSLLVTNCHDLLAQLVREAKLTGHMAVRVESEAMYIDKVASSGFVQFSTFVGQRWPLHCSASGKALLAFLPEEDKRKLLKNLHLKKVTPHTITSRRALEKQLQMFREAGYAWEREEGEPGIACVAAPVFGPANELAAAISLTGTIHQINQTKLLELGQLVSLCAAKMSGRLSGRD